MIATTEITIDDYHASDLISNSKLKTLDEFGPFGYHARHLVASAPKRERSSAMAMGQAFEDFVQLDASAFAAKWSELPAIEGKADDEMIAAALALGLTFTRRHDAKTVHLAALKARGVGVLAREDFIAIERMGEAFARNADAQAVVRGLQTQATLRDDLGGLDIIPGLQSRPDWYGPGGAPDLKTTGKFTTFDREILSLGYHRQAAMVDVIAGPHDHPLIAVESAWPYRCQVVDLPKALVDDGREWIARQLDVLRECYTRDEWPLCVTRRSASVPRWLAQKVEHDDGW